MIAVPFNDYECLGTITEVIAELVDQREPALVELAALHDTTDSLQAWMRSLPQRDDLGDPQDGPRVDACSPPQRLRLDPEDPNCVERAALYLGVAELIDPHPVRQLATLDVVSVGKHTLPLEHGAPVVLDPRVPRDCLDCALALSSETPVAIAPHQAIEWTTRLAEAGAVPLRNGPDRVRVARTAIDRLVDSGIAPANGREVDLIAWLLSVAEQVAKRYGPRALAMVRSTAQAIIELVDEAIARSERANSPQLRNLAGVAIWGSALVSIASKIGDEVGKTIVKKLSPKPKRRELTE